MNICVSKLIIIDSGNGFSPGQRKAILSTNAGILLIGPPRDKLYWNFNQNSYIYINENPFESAFQEMPFCLCLNVLSQCGFYTACLICNIDL